MTFTKSLLTLGLAFVMCYAQLGAQQPAGKMDRTILPLQEPKRPTYDELNARNATAPPRFEVKAPDGAPNVIVVLIDDLGFGATSTFGGPVATPTFDRLARGGLRYSNFHTTALCPPTRAALKSGRNHHTCIRWSSTSPATTERAARAGRTECSTNTPTSTASKRKSRTC